MPEQHTAPIKHVDVALAAIVRRDPDGPRLLITRRPDHTVFGGYWELPGGKADPGEPLPDALARECREELGVRVRADRALDIVEHVYDHAAVRLHPYLCTLVAGEVRHLQVAEHRWVRRDELADYAFPDANAPIMRELAALMSA